MVFDQVADPITQQLRLTQLQQLQQTQIRNQARCLLHPHTPHPRLVPGPVRSSSPTVARLVALRLSPVTVLRFAATAEQRRHRSSSSGPYRPCSAVRDANVLSAAQPSSRRVLPFRSRPSEHGSTVPAAARLPRVESLRPQRSASSYSDDANDPCTPTNGLSRGKRIPSTKRDGKMGGDHLLPRARAGVRVHRASICAPVPCSSVLRTRSSSMAIAYSERDTFRIRYPISRIPLSRLYPIYPPYPSIRSIVSRSPRDVNVSRV